jgi:tRNA U34 5-carboxymethylaminomethyl modifying GTPase MnmE/TrmE
MKKLFRHNETGVTKEFEVENPRTRVIPGANQSKWIAVPKPKYKSRADRRDKAVEELGVIHGELEWIKDELETKEELNEMIEQEKDEVVKADLQEQLKEREQSLEDHISNAQSSVENIDTGEVESLLDELQQWMDSMTGTNLESTGKYQMLEEAVSSLQDAVDSLNSMPNIEDVDGIEEAVNTLDEVISNLESIEFPGMFS